MIHTIQNKDDLFKVIEKIQAKKWSPSDQIHFDGWPKYEITFCGKDFNNSIPTRIIPVISNLQHEINRGYSRGIYGEVRRLSKKKRKNAELIIHLQPGSLKLIFELWCKWNDLINSALPAKRVSLILLIIAMTVSHLDVEERRLEVEERRLEVENEMHQREQPIRLLEILTRYPKIQSLAADQLTDAVRTFIAVLNSLDNDDQVTVNGAPPISGRDAQHILGEYQRPEVIEQIDGFFTINRIHDISNLDHFYIEARTINPHAELRALNSIPRIMVPIDRFDVLLGFDEARTAFNNQTPFQMQIEVTHTIRGKVRELLNIQPMDIEQ